MWTITTYMSLEIQQLLCSSSIKEYQIFFPASPKAWDRNYWSFPALVLLSCTNYSLVSWPCIMKTEFPASFAGRYWPIECRWMMDVTTSRKLEKLSPWLPIPLPNTWSAQLIITPWFGSHMGNGRAWYSWGHHTSSRKLTLQFGLKKKKRKTKKI